MANLSNITVKDRHGGLASAAPDTSVPLFEAVLPATALKPFSKMLQCLGRIGEELFLEADPGKFLFSTINSSRSAFAIATLLPRVFERYSVTAAPTVRCKVLLRAFANIFKLKPGSDNIERCKISCVVEPGGVATFIRVQMHCKHGIMKAFKLIYEPCDPLHAIYDRQQCQHTWQASPRAVAEWLQHFHSRQDEVSMICGETWAKFRTSSDGWSGAGGNGGAAGRDEMSRLMHTEISLEPDDFDLFRISGEVSLTFNLKEFKAILLFGEALQLPVSTYFQGGGSPILFAIDTNGGFSAEFVFATVTDDSASQTQSARSTPATGRTYDSSLVGGIRAAGSTATSATVERSQNVSTQRTSGITISGDARSNLSRGGGYQGPGPAFSSSAVPGTETPGYSDHTDGIAMPSNHEGGSSLTSSSALTAGLYDGGRRSPMQARESSRHHVLHEDDSPVEDGLFPTYNDDEIPPSPPRKKARSLFS